MLYRHGMIFIFIGLFVMTNYPMRGKKDGSPDLNSFFSLKTPDGNCNKGAMKFFPQGLDWHQSLDFHRHQYYERDSLIALKKAVESCKIRADLSDLDDTTKSPLHMTLFYKNEQYVKELGVFLHKGLNPNQGSFGYRPIHNAISAENLKAIELLINYGAELNYKEESIMLARMPLAWAIWGVKSNTSLAIIELLLRHGADSNHKQHLSGGLTSPLIQAVSEGFVNLDNYRSAIVAFLVRYGADPRIGNVASVMKNNLNRNEKFIKNPEKYKKIMCTLEWFGEVRSILEEKCRQIKLPDSFHTLLVNFVIRYLNFHEVMATVDNIKSRENTENKSKVEEEKASDMLHMFW